MSDIQKDWWIYKGNKTIDDLKEIEPPSWRQKKRKIEESKEPEQDIYIPTQEEKELINTAIYLRRPLLITGKPGLGKSSLAKSVAINLGLGRVLSWHINTKSTLKDGLYSYDAIGRLHDKSDDITKYLKLGALGSALASKNKRVLLIDEIDKSDIDFPNDLLHVFEENEFIIPELERLGSKKKISLYNVREDNRFQKITWLKHFKTMTLKDLQYQYNEFCQIPNEEKTVEIDNGRVICEDFPIIIMTSNSEREFSSAFMRRCIHLHIDPPSRADLVQIVNKHFGVDANEDKKISDIIDKFLELRTDTHHLANDQLLSAIYLLLNDEKPFEKSQDVILKSIWKSLS